MIQRNCKNCGAPIEHSYNHHCPYCNTLFDFNEPEDSIIKVKAEDLVNIKLECVDVIPETLNAIIKFSGYKCSQPKIYECDSNRYYISKVEEYINPPKCYMCIELSITDIQKYRNSYIKHIIYSTGIRLNELDSVYTQVIYELSKTYLFPYLD